MENRKRSPETVIPQVEEVEYATNLERAEHELYLACSGLTDYLHDNKVKNLILLDRNARQAYIGVRECWKDRYAEEPQPRVYFLNPKGFKTLRDMDPREMFVHVLKDHIPSKILQEMDEALGEELPEPISFIREEREIVAELKVAYRRLFKDPTASTVVFDTCMHTGDSMRPVLRALKKAGLQNIRTGVVSNHRCDTDGLDFVVLPRAPFDACHPFSGNESIQKTYQHVFSRRSPDYVDRENGISLREWIREIIQTELLNEKTRAAFPDGKAVYETGTVVTQLRPSDRLLLHPAVEGIKDIQHQDKVSLMAQVGYMQLFGSGQPVSEQRLAKAIREKQSTTAYPIPERRIVSGLPKGKDWEIRETVELLADSSDKELYILESSAGVTYSDTLGYDQPWLARELKATHQEKAEIVVTSPYADGSKPVTQAADLPGQYVLLEIDTKANLHIKKSLGDNWEPTVGVQPSQLMGNEYGYFAFKPLAPEEVEWLSVTPKPDHRYYLRPALDPIFEQLVFGIHAMNEETLWDHKTEDNPTPFDYTYTRSMLGE